MRPSFARAAFILILHYIIGQERQRAGFADHNRPKSVSPDGVPDRHRRKAPQMAGDFESRPSKPKILQNQLLRWRREQNSNRRYGGGIASIFQRLRDVVGPETATERFPPPLRGLFP